MALKIQPKSRWRLPGGLPWSWTKPYFTGVVTNRFYINALTKSNCSTLWIRSVWKWYPTDTEASRIIEESPFLCFMELSEISLTASSMRGISAGEEKSCAGLKESRFTVWIVLRGVALYSFVSLSVDCGKKTVMWCAL